MVRVGLFTDVPILAAGLAQTLASAREMQLVFACEHAANLIEQIQEHSPQVLLLNRTQGVTFGLLADLRRQVPRCGVVLWVRAISPELAFLVMELGVRGIIRKTVSNDNLLECLRRVAEGEVWFEPRLTSSFLTAKSVALTRRESELVTLLSQGLSNKEIATMLRVSESTVRAYLTKLFLKVGAKDRFELAVYGLKNLAQMAAWRTSEDGRPPSAAVLDKEDLDQMMQLRFLVVEKPTGRGVVRWPVWEF